MIENENLVTEQNEVAENAEHTAEQTPKMYTEEEFNQRLNDVIGKKLARKEAKLRKEYDKKYGELENVLRAGTGKENVEEMTDMFKEHYAARNVKIPDRQNYSDSDLAVLAKAEADEIIGAGYDEVVEEVDRLAAIGAEKMTPRERALFKTLAEHRVDVEKSKELEKIGVSENDYKSEDFKAFASKFSHTTPIKEVYDIYQQTRQQKNIKPMGSMKNTTVEPAVKDYYSYEEAKKFTIKDFDKNPALYEAVKRSMTKWK